MSKLMYSELGGFAHFREGEAPAGWVDGEPVRKALQDAKAGVAKPVETVTIQTVTPQDTPPRRPGRPPKIAEEI